MFRFCFFICCFLGVLFGNEDPHHIMGIGASTIDLLIQVDDAFICEHVPGGKGAAYPCDSKIVDRVLLASKKTPKIVPGGSAANTIRALAKLGEHCSFFGYVGMDLFGEHFCENLQKLGVEEKLIKSSLFSTSCVLCLVSSDGQRSFLGYDPKATDLYPAPEQFKNVEWVHFEARRLDADFAVEKAMLLAKKAGARISIGLSSHEIVEKYKKTLLHLISHYVDIVFCNESEILALVGLSSEEGCMKLQEICPVSVVTLGAHGCLVGHKGKLVKAPAFKADVVDTTGAGDLFAAGFLYGYLHEYPLDRCAQIGNRLGCAIVEVVGAELPEERWAPVRDFIRLQRQSSGLLGIDAVRKKA